MNSSGQEASGHPCMEGQKPEQGCSSTVNDKQQKPEQRCSMAAGDVLTSSSCSDIRKLQTDLRRKDGNVSYSKKSASRTAVHCSNLSVNPDISENTESGGRRSLSASLPQKSQWTLLSNPRPTTGFGPSRKSVRFGDGSASEVPETLKMLK